MKRTFIKLAWREVRWQRPYKMETVTELLLHLATLTPRGPAIVWEARGCQGRVRFYIGAEQQYMKKVMAVLQTHGNMQFAEVPETARAAVSAAKQLKISHPNLPLNVEVADATIRSGLAALLSTRGREQTVLQIVLGPSYTPSPMPKYLPDPHASWFRVALGNVDPATTESRTAYKEKISSHGFNAVIRLGASGTTTTAPAHVLNLLSALRTLQSAGVILQTAAENPAKLDAAHVPWSFPLRLNVKELSPLLLLPANDAELPGVGGLHPKQVFPPAWIEKPSPNNDRTFAVSLDGNTKLSLSPQDSLQHLHVLGPTGVGKSTVLLNLIMADIKAGRSVLVLDPKDLTNHILSRFPKERDEDLIIINGSADNPVGFNPIEQKSNKNPNLVADSTYAVMQEIFRDSFGAYTKDVLFPALLTLAQTKNASLLWLVPLLTDEAFRKKVTAGVKDKIALEPYWATFNEMSEAERRLVCAPVIRKLRQFLLRPGLRNVLGQSQPKFSMSDLFEKPRVVLVQLNKALVGAEGARLLGSLIVGHMWNIALSRADIAERRHRLVSVYIDEFQDFVSSIATDFSEALAMARSLCMGLTLANQHREQLPQEIRTSTDTNCRSKIAFSLAAADAKSMAAQAPGLDAVDFQMLPTYQIYTSYQSGNRNTGWVSGKTLPMSPVTRNRVLLRNTVMERYGKPGAEVEQEYLDLLAQCHAPGADGAGGAASGSVGRRKIT